MLHTIISIKPHNAYTFNELHIHYFKYEKIITGSQEWHTKQITKPEIKWTTTLFSFSAHCHCGGLAKTEYKDNEYISVNNLKCFYYCNI